MKREQAFTLVELLVAAAVGLILIGVLVGIVQQVLGNYERTQANSAVSQEGDFALDMLVSDLEALSLPNSRGKEGFRATVERVEGQEFVWLTLLTRPVDRDAKNHLGTVRNVSYRVAYQDPVQPGGANRMFALYRSVATTEETFMDGLEDENLQIGFWAEAGRGNPSPAEFLVGNVAEFQVRFLPRDQTDWEAISALGHFLSVRRGETTMDISGGMQPLPNGVARMEVSLTVLEARGATLLKSGAISRERALREYGHSFTRQVAIKIPKN